MIFSRCNLSHLFIAYPIDIVQNEKRKHARRNSRSRVSLSITLNE